MYQGSDHSFLRCIGRLGLHVCACCVKTRSENRKEQFFLLNVVLLSTSDRLGLGNLTAVHLVNKFPSFINLKDHYRMGIAMGAGSAAVPGGKNVYFKRKKKKRMICRKIQILNY